MYYFQIEFLLMAILGGIIGSFLNMLIYRLPLAVDTVFKRSHCPSCSQTLGVKDLIPVFSFLFQRGRCRHCSIAIPRRYLWVELVTISVTLMIYTHFGLSWLMLKWLLFFWTMIVLFVTDWMHFYLPDRLTFFIIGMGGVWAFYFHHIETSGKGFLLGGGVYLLISSIGRLIYRKPVMGLGDVKLGAAIGMYWGLKVAALTCYLSFVLGGIWGVGLLLLKQKKRSDEIPFGPFIIVASIISLLFGEDLWRVLWPL